MTTSRKAKRTVRREAPPLVALSTIAGAATFAELVTMAGGRHPTELLELLKGLDGSYPSLRPHVQMLIDQATKVAAGHEHPQGRGLALPHPIDCEWRFTDQTADNLLAAAGEITKPGDTILLMGVPSVAVAALRSTLDRRFSLVGENNIISGQLLKLSASDARFDHNRPGEHFAAAAILDPPWYPDHFSGMLAEAASRCTVGANVLLSTPSESVRPSIPDDIRKIEEVAGRCGLEIAGNDRDALGYRTPFFEMNALRASGVGAWLPAWRRGDLRIFRKTVHFSEWNCKLPERSGFEVTLAGIRLRLLDIDAVEATGDLVPIHAGEIFPSVSMRAPCRSEAVLWTSGNRAFTVEHSICLEALLRIAEDRRLLPEGLYHEISFARKAEAIDRINPLIQKLLDLADREFAEATNALGPDAWETAANDARFLSASLRGFHRSRAGASA